MKSRKTVTRILVALEDKRDYVLTNEKISDNNIRHLVNLCDNVMVIIEGIYDDIISNQGIMDNNINTRLDTLNNQVKLYKEKING